MHDGLVCYGAALGRSVSIPLLSTGWLAEDRVRPRGAGFGRTDDASSVFKIIGRPSLPPIITVLAFSDVARLRVA